MKFLNSKDLTLLAAGFALEVGVWTYFLFGMMIEDMAIDVIVVLIFLAGLHYIFKLAIRRHDRAHLIIMAFILGVLGVVASESVAAVSSAIMGGGTFSYTFERDLLGYLALFGAHFVPAALCAYGVRRPAPASTQAPSKN